MTEKKVWQSDGRFDLGRLKHDAVTCCDELRKGPIRKGDAETIALYFSEAVKRGTPVDQDVMMALAAAFDRYLTGVASSIDKSLGIVRARAGNPGSRSSKRRLQNDEERTDLSHRVAELMDVGMSYEDAIEETRIERRVSKRTAEGCYRELSDRTASYLAELITRGVAESEAIERAINAIGVSEKFVRRALRKMRRAVTPS